MRINEDFVEERPNTKILTLPPSVIGIDENVTFFMQIIDSP